MAVVVVDVSVGKKSVVVMLVSDVLVVVSEVEVVEVVDVVDEGVVLELL